MDKDNYLFKYRIIKALENDDTSSIYLVLEEDTNEKFILRKVLSDTGNPLNETAIKEFKGLSKEKRKIEEKNNAPAILDVYVKDNENYLLLEYKGQDGLKSIISYPSIGKILNNRYVVVRGISYGGFGKVYLIRDLSLPGKYWALKEMQEQAEGKDVIEKSFRVEAEMLSSLEHPSIPGITDFFIEKGKLYLVMDYVHGETLKKSINKGELITEEKALELTIKLCDVLHYLHNRPSPIIFRDLKPDNIMITPEGEIKLIDFGIAKIFKGTKSDTTHLLLTEGYAPQEQWMGKAEPRSDIYSLGATIYHLMTGIHPRRVAPDFPPVMKFNSSVSHELNEIIIKSLKLNPSERFANAYEMKEALSNLNVEKEKKEKGRKHLEKAREFESKNDFFNANFEYMKALEFLGNAFDVLSGMALCCEKLGFTDKAMENYNKILELEISDSQKEEIRNKINNNIKTIPVKLKEKRIPVKTGETTIPVKTGETTIPVKTGETTIRAKTRETTIPAKTQDINIQVKEEIYKKEEQTISKKRPIKSNNKVWTALMIGGIIALPIVIVLFILLLIGGILLIKPDLLFGEKAEELNKKGNISYKNGRYEEAVNYYEQALKIKSDLPEIWCNKGNSLFRLSKYDEALECYNKALEINPDYPEGITGKGKIDYIYGRYESAIKYYDIVLQSHPDYVNALNEKGNALYYQGKYDEAQEYYDKALNANPQYGYAWYGKGIVSYMEGNTDEALEYYDKALTFETKDPVIWFNKGKLLDEQKKYNEAIACYDKSIEIYPKYDVPWSYKGNILYNQYEYEEALKCFEEAIKLNPNNSIYLSDKGNALVGLMKYDEAGEAYEKALKINPQDGIAWNGKGLIEYDKGNHEEAIKYYDKALKFNPEDAVIWSNKGLALYEKNDYEEARKCYNKSLKINPNNAGVWINKGNAFYGEALFDEALACYEKSIELEPLGYMGWYKKGLSLYSLESYSEAIDAFDKCLEINPSYTDASSMKEKAQKAMEK